MKRRCGWCAADPLYIDYHDQEWGLPLHEDRRLFEMLTLEGAQAGLSWLTILKKRDSYRKAFANFEAVKIAKYGPRQVQQLLRNTGIVRHRKKIQAAVQNARAFLKVAEEFGSFDRFIWQFVGHKPIQNRWTRLEDIPSRTLESEAMSRELKKRGFSFVGSTICYAFMQATGMVNDHRVDCFRYAELRDSSLPSE